VIARHHLLSAKTIAARPPGTCRYNVDGLHPICRATSAAIIMSADSIAFAAAFRAMSRQWDENTYKEVNLSHKPDRRCRAKPIPADPKGTRILLCDCQTHRRSPLHPANYAAGRDQVIADILVSAEATAVRPPGTYLCRVEALHPTCRATSAAVMVPDDSIAFAAVIFMASNAGGRPPIRHGICLAAQLEAGISNHTLRSSAFTRHLRSTYMNSMLPNINERSVMNRRYLPPIGNTYSRAEVDAIVAAVLAKTAADMDSMIRRFAELADKKFGRVDEYFRAYSREIDDLRATISPRPPASAVMPPAGSITRITAQFFDNRHRNAALKARGKRATFDNFRLKLYVWSCPRDECYRHPEGNHGNKQMTMFQPNTNYARKHLGANLDYLGTDAQYVGCLNLTAGPRRQIFEQAAAISHELRLHLVIDGEVINLGLPRSRPANAEPDAARYRWTWPAHYAD
jgi:hypothetical protein